jgi:hypothetical protein
MGCVGGARSKGLLPGHSFPGGLLKGGISMKQVPAGTGRSELSTTTPFGGCVEGFVRGCFVVVGGVWHTVGSWDNNVPRSVPLVGAGGGVGLFPVFLRMTFRSPCGTRTLCVCWVGGVCVVGLLFENYIVNASIFIKKQFL